MGNIRLSFKFLCPSMNYLLCGGDPKMRQTLGKISQNIQYWVIFRESGGSRALWGHTENMED